MAKQTIEIDVPEGMRVSRIDFLGAGTPVVNFEPLQKTKWRPPTKLDLLGVDSIPARVRDALHDDWMERTITAVASDGDLKYGTSHCFWRYAEIEVPIDEQPPRELFGLYEIDGTLLSAFHSDLVAKSLCNGTVGSEVIHMVEVREPK